VPGPDPTTRYRRAWQAGSEGRQLPKGLADRADADPRIDEAYDAGSSQTPFGDFLTAHGLTPAPSSSPPSPRASSSSGGGVVSRISSGGENLGSVALGFLLAALALSVIQYGPKGPLYWFEAKFLNDAKAPAGAKSSAPASTGPVGPTGPLAPPAAGSGDLLPGASSSVPAPPASTTSGPAGPLQAPATLEAAI
jgi:hypothetical protein